MVIYQIDVVVYYGKLITQKGILFISFILLVKTRLLNLIDIAIF